MATELSTLAKIHSTMHLKMENVIEFKFYCNKIDLKKFSDSLIYFSPTPTTSLTPNKAIMRQRKEYKKKKKFSDKSDLDVPLNHHRSKLNMYY